MGGNQTMPPECMRYLISLSLPPLPNWAIIKKEIHHRGEGYMLLTICTCEACVITYSYKDVFFADYGPACKTKAPRFKENAFET